MSCKQNINIDEKFKMYGFHIYKNSKKVLAFLKDDKIRKIPIKNINTLLSLKKYVNKLMKLILSETDIDKIVGYIFIMVLILIGVIPCEDAIQKSLGDVGKDFYTVYEFGRCIFPTKFILNLKYNLGRHPNWKDLKPIYTILYNYLYEDLTPEYNVLDISYQEEMKAFCHT